MKIIVTAFIIMSLFDLLIGYLPFSVIFRKGYAEKTIFRSQRERHSHKNRKKELTTESIWLKTPDCEKLHGLTIRRTDTADWVICVHGLAEHAGSMLSYACHFYEKGYNILIPDLRAHGESGYKYRGGGYLDAVDLDRWIQSLRDSQNAGEIILFGVSMGGLTILQYCALKKTPAADRIIVDSAPLDLCDQVSYLPKCPSLVMRLVVAALDFWTKLILGFSLKSESLKNHLSEIQIPILIIQGTKDRMVPVSVARSIYDGVRGNKRLVYIEGAGHIGGAKTDPEKYWKEVDNFLER